MPPPLELTLILAATRDMGIGLNGTLPWTGLRREMAYFARVTKRIPTSLPPTSLNAVIMGRKTWDSIPPRFRPLKGRLNVVISRSVTGPPAYPGDVNAEPVMASSLEQALAFLREQKQRQKVGRVFVIGGAQIYGAALGSKETRRVLLTRVLSDFECDAFFPLELKEGVEGWKRVGQEEFGGWVGEEVEGGVQEEAGTRYEFEMWERGD
ncbi:dihydrofolate reductase-like domain-containing protein [Podospora aff. communis PSN243]|uniref:Dihydrofolate reductase n=1 Tax=Podospora aff. communis PSN243 TaxID=3040156 RepID=A0AAV9G402_9PEZI|nr:dihydrofolate reductase-like domain-containing protein [Podospora aff. communis PSN243]